MKNKILKIRPKNEGVVTYSHVHYRQQIICLVSQLTSPRWDVSHRQFIIVTELLEYVTPVNLCRRFVAINRCSICNIFTKTYSQFIGDNNSHLATRTINARKRYNAL